MRIGGGCSDTIGIGENDQIDRDTRTMSWEGCALGVYYKLEGLWIWCVLVVVGVITAGLARNSAFGLWYVRNKLGRV